MNTPITSPTAGLLARYGLNEGTGTAVGDSIAPAENGTAQPTANAPRGLPAHLRSTVTSPLRLPRLDLPRRRAKGTSPSTGTTTARATLLATTSTGEPRARSALPARRSTAARRWSPRSTTTRPERPALTYFYVVTAEDTSGNESDASNEVSDSPDPFSQAALQFDGTNDHVSLGSAAGLGATNFTLEAWIKRTGAGATVSTGANGLDRRPAHHEGSPRPGRHHRGHELLLRPRRNGPHRGRLRGLRRDEQQPPIHRVGGRLAECLAPRRRNL